MEHDPDAIPRLLDQRFGDGSIYLHDEEDQRLLEEARRRGLVSDDGYVTRAGLECWARWEARGGIGATVPREKDRRSASKKGAAGRAA